MSKFILALTVFFGGLSVISAQEKPLVSKPAGQKDYSESMPYEPRKFDETLLSKREKKSKIKSDGKEKSPTDKTVSTPPTDSGASVKIPVFVYEANGNPVTDLKNSEIKLFFDAAEYEITAFEPAGQALDIVLLVDTSPSTVFNTDDVKNFVTKLTENLKPEDKIQIISFNGELKVLCDSTDDKEIIKKAIKKLKMGDGTSIYETVETIFQKHLNLNSGQKTVILLSDGVDTTSLRADYISSLFAAEKNASVVFPFYLDTFTTAQRTPMFRVPNGTILNGRILSNRLPRPSLGNPTRVGTSQDEYDLGLEYIRDIAKLSGGRAFQLKDMAATKADELQTLLALMKPLYFVTFKPANADYSNKRNQLKIRINRPNLTVYARGSYITQ